MVNTERLMLCYEINHDKDYIMLLKKLNEKTTSMYVNVTEAIRGFKRDEKGVTAVEYAIVIAGVAAVVAVIFGKGGTVQTMLNDIFGDIKQNVADSMSGAGNGGNTP